MRAALAALAGLVWAGGAEAGCRLALVLALDVSSSVDAEEYRLQRLGLAAALDAPEVRHAILSGGRGHVALAVYEWGGLKRQKLHLDWAALREGRDIDLAVLAVGAMTRHGEGSPTALGQALGYGAALLARGPACDRRVIDVSGDGVNNYGMGPRTAYRHFGFDGVTVNGLVIREGFDYVADYYLDNVLRGRHAFLEVADGFEDFRRAMTRKLYREINDIVLSGRPGAVRGRGG